jgi:hypothetical protein
MLQRGSKSVDESDTEFVEKSKADVYTVLLALSFVAVLIACICLSLEMAAYDWDMSAR